MKMVSHHRDTEFTEISFNSFFLEYPDASVLKPDT